MKRVFQRGYNLVEIAIVLTVFLMMSSWLAVNYYEVQKDQRVTETERTLELIKESIVDYAVKNRIRSFSVSNGNPGVPPDQQRVRWIVPGDRPYLPCPDITGDGVEDRLPLFAPPPPSAEPPLILATDYEAHRAGDCYRYKGLVPWRTLNTPPADAWGNYFTYRVDPDFAHSLLGFDQESTSDDGHDLGGNSAPVRVDTGSGRTLIVRTGVAGADENIRAPTSGNADVSGIWGGNIDSERSPSLICSFAPCSYSANATVFIQGTVAIQAETVQTGGYGENLPVFTEFAVGNIISGLPVVILSHGENGHGAVIYRPDGGIACLPMPDDHEDERQNAYWPETGVSGCARVVPAAGTARSNGFVIRDYANVPAAASAGNFDDIVDWMSAEELSAKLVQRGVFPVEKLPPVGLEAY